MSSRLKGMPALVLVAAVLAGPVSASATPGGRAPVSTQPRGDVSFYREVQQAQTAEARFYASTSASSGDGSSTLGDALVASLILLAGGGAVAAWWFNRDDPAPRAAAAH